MLKNQYLAGILKVSDEYRRFGSRIQDPDPNPDPLVRGIVFRDDPVWEDWYQDAHGVQGGLEDSGSSSESEDEIAQPVILPTTCICNHCRLVPVLWIHDIFGWIRIRIRIRIGLHPDPLDPDPDP